MLEINTNTLKSRKKVLIDGQQYIVRKLGAGEELSLSQAMRKLEKLGNKEKSGDLTEAEQDQAIKLAQSTLDTLISTFDDGGDGSKAKALISGLSAEELKEVYDKIFEEQSEPNETNTPEAS